MKPCRDCGAPTAPSARSCPHCGILNPVQQWVAMPNGEHLTHREPTSPGAAAAALRAAPAFGGMSAPAPAFAGSPAAAAAILAKPKASGEPGFGDDRLASWAIWAILFAVLSTFVIGGLIGGAIAAVLAIPVGKMLPTGADGRKLPVWMSGLIIALAVLLFVARIFFGVAMRTAAQ